MESVGIVSPWQSLSSLIDANEVQAIRTLLGDLEPFEIARTISRLTPENQSKLLKLLDPNEAATVLEEVPEKQAAGIIEQMPVEDAAAILGEIRSDQQADLLGSMAEPDAEAILKNMAPDQATGARSLLDYKKNSAGGLMMTEYLAYPEDWTVADLIEDLERKRESVADYSVQYLYIVDDYGRLVGVFPIRDLVFSPVGARLSSVMIRNPLILEADASLDEIEQFFERNSFLGAPVVNKSGRLVGVVHRSAVVNATRQNVTRQFLRFSGIVGGEEFRTMPLLARSGRRLSWLTINIVLNIVAASVIAIYTDTLAAVIALAVFLPMISDMSGCSGNQAVAVSMRELTLGLIRPTETARILAKEAAVGVLNGVFLGSLLAAVAVLWKGNPYLGLVVGAALAANTIVAVCLGGSLPLVLKRMKLDPALVSGPLLTTVTDVCGFFFTLGFATLLLHRLAGG
jgi:magnesium transporter